MSISFVLGNGCSRSNFDLRQLYGVGTTYGCNAIHRDFGCNNVVSVRRSHLTEAVTWNIHLKQYLWTTTKLSLLLKNPNIEILPDFPFALNSKHTELSKWTSIGYATLLASQSSDTIIFIGVDFGGQNIYEGTDNYSKEVSKDFSPHIEQLLKIINHYNNKQFVFIDSINNNKLQAFYNVSNVSIDTYENLQTLLLT